MYVYGATAVVLGVIGLVWRDFATSWQRVGPDVPHRVLLAYIAALAEVCGGLALFWRRSAQAGALMLTLLYLVFVALWVPRVIAAPAIYDGWGNFFEESSLVIGGLVLCAALAVPDSAFARREALISRLYGICVISFGLVHFIYFSGAASWVPQWIPPGQRFWAATTGACFLLAAASILTGIQAVLASRLLTIMIMAFEVLVWAPKLLTTPHDHFAWAGNGICLVMGAAAWVVADSFCRQREGVLHPQDASVAAARPEIIAS
jgi:uncharacterized membrane protein